MKTSVLFLAFVLSGFTAHAQTVYVYLATAGSTNVSYQVPTNDTVTVVGNMNPVATVNGYNALGHFSLTLGQTYTGLTNVAVMGAGAGFLQTVTLAVNCPQTTAIVSNYVPADAIVIPASVTGNVQIILESSPDLVNWTAAQPGLYGPSAATNRFFRVRAAVQ